jgi:lipopolysaccharide transport system permease protein
MFDSVPLLRLPHHFLASGHINLNHLLYSFGFMLVVVIIGSIIFNRVEQTFMDTV